MALIEWCEAEFDLNKSQALRHLLGLAEATLNGNAKREIAERRVTISSQVRKAAASPPSIQARCPSCGDTDLYVALSGGRWRCDNCMASG
jgi:hypothetical protein